MSKTTQEYLVDIQQGMGDLDEIKKVLYPQLSNTKVRISKTGNAEVYNEVVKIFGDRPSDDPNKDFITFDMFMHCLGIIKLAGKSKGQETLSRHGL